MRFDWTAGTFLVDTLRGMLRRIVVGALWVVFSAAVGCSDGGGDGDSGGQCDAALPGVEALLDGEWDERFVLPGMNGEAPGVFATALGPDGVVYVGGFFSHAGRTEARNVAAWSAQGGWTALGDGVEGAVTAAAVAPDGALWVSTSNWSSDFTSYYHLVLRWNDGAWEEIAEVELPEFLSEPQRSGIQRMQFDTGGDLIVAGEFVSIDGAPVSHLAALRGTTWRPIGTAPDAPVYALSADGDEICAGGLFDSIGGVAASRVACWDGAEWTPRDLVDELTGGLVRALARGPDGALYAGGLFMLSDPSTYDGGSIARWDGAEWQLVERGLGIWDVFAQQNTPGLVRDLAWAGDELLVGGSFYNAGGTSSTGDPSVEVQHLASISLESASWKDAGAATLGVGVAFGGDNVFSLASAGGRVFVGGLFSSVGGSTAFNVARRITRGWAPLASPEEGAFGVEGSVTALAHGPCDVYVGGNFARAGGVASSNVATFRPGAGFAALGAGLEGPVTALTVDAATGDLYAAEQVCVQLPELLDCAQTRVHRWDGEAWTTFAETSPGSLFTLVLGADGSLYGGGSVADDGGSGGVVRWTGSEWEPLGGGVVGVVLSLFDDGEGGLVAAGAFETAGGSPARNIARWDGTSWSPLGEGLASQVQALASFDGRIVAGTQKGFGGDPAVPLIAAWDGATWENIGAALEEGAPNPQIQALVSGGDFLIAVGQFPFLGGAALFDGADWTVLTDMNHMGGAALLRSEGLYLGGGFSLVDGGPAVGVSLLRPASP
jgi:trimeric autotransporter adhesin